MNYSEYDRVICRSMFVWILVGVLFVSACCICLVYLLKNKPKKHNKIEEKLEFWTLFVLSVAVIVGTLLLVTPIVRDALSDINNKSYVRYEGEFTVVYDNKTPSRSCSIILPDGNRFNRSTNMRDAGTYAGIIVYAERSHQIVYIEYIESENGVVFEPKM